INRYHSPIVREIQTRARCSAAEAEELTQQFIHDWLRRDFLKNVDPEKGRFRTFIKRCIVNFLCDVYRRKAAQPQPVSLDQTDENGERTFEPSAEIALPEAASDRLWARQILALAMDQLERECVAARRGALLSRLKPFLAGDPENDSY